MLRQRKVPKRKATRRLARCEGFPALLARLRARLTRRPKYMGASDRRLASSQTGCDARLRLRDMGSQNQSRQRVSVVDADPLRRMGGAKRNPSRSRINDGLRHKTPSPILRATKNGQNGLAWDAALGDNREGFARSCSVQIPHVGLEIQKGGVPCVDGDTRGADEHKCVLGRRVITAGIAGECRRIGACIQEGDGVSVDTVFPI